MEFGLRVGELNAGRQRWDSSTDRIREGQRCPSRGEWIAPLCGRTKGCPPAGPSCHACRILSANRRTGSGGDLASTKRSRERVEILSDSKRQRPWLLTAVSFVAVGLGQRRLPGTRRPPGARRSRRGRTAPTLLSWRAPDRRPAGGQSALGGAVATRLPGNRLERPAREARQGYQAAGRRVPARGLVTFLGRVAGLLVLGVLAGSGSSCGTPGGRRVALRG